MTNHYKNVCECGIKMSQCKCLGPHSIRIVSPCSHVIANEVVSEPISYESLLKNKEEVEELGQIPNLLRCHASVYNAIRLYFDKKEADDMVAGFKKQSPSYLGEVLGVDVYIDKNMKPGEWRFERRFYE